MFPSDKNVSYAIGEFPETSGIIQNQGSFCQI